MPESDPPTASDPDAARARSSAAGRPTAPPSSFDSRRSRSFIGRFGPRVVVFPLIVLAVAWMLQSRNAGVEQRRQAVIRADVQQFIADAARGRTGEDLGEAAPGLLGPAASVVGEIAADGGPERLAVVVERGDAGPGHPSAGTHTATILDDGAARLHLRVGVAGDRTVLAGWWRPESPD